MGTIYSGRSLTWPWFVAVVVAYLAIIQGTGLLVGIDPGTDDTDFPTPEAIARNGVIPVGLSLLFTVGLVTWLGWWRSVVRWDLPVRRWVRLVPISMLVAALIGIGYSRLADQTVGLVLCLLLFCLMVGFTEELMFRGIGADVFRRGDFTEGKVALWTSIIFGLAHLSNAISTGPQALLQAAVVSTSGYFLYLAFRVAGVIALPMLVHAFWDFSLISNSAGIGDTQGIGVAAILLVQLALIVLLVVRRKKVEPPREAPAPARSG